MHIKEILYTELIIGAVIFLHFYGLPSLPVIGDFHHQLVRGIVVFSVLLYLPGYRWSWVFFKEDDLTNFERFVCSFAISLGWIVFVSIYLTYAGGFIDTFHTVLISCLAILLGIGITLYTNTYNKS